MWATVGRHDTMWLSRYVLFLLWSTAAGDAWGPPRSPLLQRRERMPSGLYTSHTGLAYCSQPSIKAAKPFDDDPAWFPSPSSFSATHHAGFSPSSTLPGPATTTREAHALACLDACPLVAVLRGVTTTDMYETLQTLRQAGLTMVSVPAESPAGFEGLKALASLISSSGAASSFWPSHAPTSGSGYDETLPPLALGAATVVSVAQVDLAAAAGASFISCPHTDPDIILRAHKHGILCLPGILTPTEAFLALKYGAKVLKLFPSQAVPPGMVASIAAILPPPTRLLVSGGVKAEDMPAYRAAGAKGFALGSTLFQAGLKGGELASRARAFVQALERAPDGEMEGEAFRGG